MSNKRYALAPDDITLILVSLQHLHQSSSINPAIFPQYAEASAQRINQIKVKLGIKPTETDK